MIYDLHPKIFHDYKNILVVESVEDSKSLTYVDTLIDKLILLGCNRSSFIVGVEGIADIVIPDLHDGHCIFNRCTANNYLIITIPFVGVSIHNS